MNERTVFEDMQNTDTSVPKRKRNKLILLAEEITDNLMYRSFIERENYRKVYLEVLNILKGEKPC